MLDRLGHGKIHEADAHPGSKEHREPRDIGEIGFGIVGPELQIARRPETERKDDRQEDGDGRDIEPAEGIDRPCLRGLERVIGTARHGQRRDEQGDDDGGRTPEHAGIDVTC